MKDITYLKGDATNPIGTGHKVIAHVCNNKGGWGKGFVKSISKKWKEPEELYRSVGELILGDTFGVEVEPDIIVFNMIAQDGYRCKDNTVAIRYDALRECFERLLNYIDWCGEKDISIHMPRIGCGLAVGSWDKIEPIIKKCFSENDIQVYIYDFN